MGMDLQSKIRLALGMVKDHVSIGKATIYYPYGFSSLEIAVVRATGHDYSPIDDKYMHEILFLVSNSPGSIPFLAERISYRLDKTRDRLVALKSLMLIHCLLRGGNRSFELQLRSAHVSGHLQMSTKWFPRNNSDHSLCFLHNYAAYMEERMSWLINQAGKLEPIMPKCLDLQFYDEKTIDLVFRRLPKCQAFLEKVLNCSPLNILPSDSLAQAAMCNTLKESFQVYKTFCEGVAALVNMFFDLKRSARAFACDILKRASKQSQELYDMYETCKRIMGSKNLEFPYVQVIAMDHVLALEQSVYSTPKAPNELLSSTKSCSSPPIFNCLKKSTELQATMADKEGGEAHEKRGGENSLSMSLFSCKLETKISKVWVVFDDDDHDEEAEEKL
ncbi:AP180 N-terminal homology (ANTH) domain [Dillenia turbinata]|uniref:AP180 N-terminal homology (ANTH) domain n=1 Tax=Dillenia turbinata TaxID=194707 RepID=A0AAN8W2J7_9MAGN